MPYINFMWYPTADSERVVGIVNELRAVADSHNVITTIPASSDATSLADVNLQDRLVAVSRFLFQSRDAVWIGRKESR